MQVTVTRQPDPLHKEEWKFMLFDSHGATGRLVLTDYARLTRPSPRHRNWQYAQHYYYLTRRDRQVPGALEAVPWPADVQTEALQLLIAQVTVEKTL